MICGEHHDRAQQIDAAPGRGLRHERQTGGKQDSEQTQAGAAEKDPHDVNHPKKREAHDRVHDKGIRGPVSGHVMDK